MMVVLGTVVFFMVIVGIAGLGAGLWAAFVNPRVGGYTGGMSAEERKEFKAQERHEDLLRMMRYSGTR